MIDVDWSNAGSLFINGDCMDYMRTMPDKCVDLALVDPPYGGVTNGGYMSNANTQSGSAKHKKYNLALWSQEKPLREYFDELKRVSKNQIVWGGNYFQTLINADSQCWIVWDKKNENTGFADCELAWTSFNTATRKFEYRWNGMLQGNMKDKEDKIHPTQKPVALYLWLLQNYAHRCDKILDTHVGSASSLIACHRMGFDYWGFELDADYYKAASERLEREKAQQTLFSPEEIYKPQQQSLI